MKSLIDIPSGTVVFIPENRADRILLFHLINCTDLTQFNSYLKVENTEEMTPELGVTFDQFNGYIEEAMRPVGQLPRMPVDRAACTPEIQGRLIGFDRDSSHEGCLFKRRPV